MAVWETQTATGVSGFGPKPASHGFAVGTPVDAISGRKRFGSSKLLPMAYYRKPGWFTSTIFNPFVAAMTRAGISVWGSRILRVRGRKSGALRTSPVNLLTHNGTKYLVAPRGLTQWVRNLREAGEGELMLGTRVERFRAHEIPDDQKIPILRAYLKRWKAEVGIFFGGVSADSPEEDLRRIAPDHPVFSIEMV